MTITLRPYQTEAICELNNFWIREPGKMPLIELATGLGKSLVIADVARNVIERFPGSRIIILAHVQELIGQNYSELKALWPSAPAGIYSAGLKRRDTAHRIIFASIQSVYDKASLLGPRNLMMIDEAHLLSPSQSSMYRTFINGLKQIKPKMSILGLTATPYRMDSGFIHRGDEALFDELVYSYGIGEGVDDGYLAPLTARVGATQIDTRGVGKRGGEYIAGALEEAAMKDEVIKAACDDMVARGANRRSWLVFCTGVRHAAKVEHALIERGISCEVVTGDTHKDQRKSSFDRFKAGELRALVGVNVMTTGFNAPAVDLIALLRPTLSTSLYVQMLGRGTRVDGVDLRNYATAEDRKAAIAASTKPDCLILDYAGNVRRHGPVDEVNPKAKKPNMEEEEEKPEKVKDEDVRAKECPECGTLCSMQTRECPTCGHTFAPPKHAARPEDVVIIARRELVNWCRVMGWGFAVHTKMADPGAPPTLRVTYHLQAGPQITEWVCFSHTGYARTKAEVWWKEHGGEHPPGSTENAFSAIGELKMPTSIVPKKDGNFLKVGRRRFEEPVEQLIHAGSEQP
jgi:DNA repair protein RadD